MAKEKAAKVTKKKDEGKKSKKAAKSASKEFGLSAELVVDSESEQEAKVAKVERKSKKSEEKPSKKKRKAPVALPPPKEPTPSESSDEEETDSDEEMPDAPIVPKKPESIPAKVNGVKRKAENERSPNDAESSDKEESDESTNLGSKRVKTVPAEEDAEDSSDEEETESESSEEVKAEKASTTASKAPAATAKAKPTKPAAPVKEKEKDSDPSTESSDENDTDSEEEKKQSKEARPASQTAASMARTEAVPVRPFKPPHGHSESSVTGSILPAGSMTGKQIWTITAPSNVPIKALKEIAPDSISSGSPVLEHNGIHYDLNNNKSNGNECEAAVLPSKNSYDTVPQKISRRLALQRKIDLPDLSAKQADSATGSKAAADVAIPPVSTARPQPKGMRMRYKPPGFGAGDPGLGSDTEDEASRPTKKDKSLQFPKALGAHVPSDKPDVETPKVKKSRKKQRNQDVEMVNGHEPAPPPPSELRLSKSISKESVERPGSKDGLSKEERRKRKEEKRAKKEGKVRSTA